MEDQDLLERELRRLEESHLQPDVRQSAEAMTRLLADDFVEIGSSGVVFSDKRAIVEALQHSASSRMSLSDFRVTVLAPGVALTTYRVIKHDELPPGHSLRSSIWKRMDGRWQMVFHQGTPTVAPDG